MLRPTLFALLIACGGNATPEDTGTTPPTDDTGTTSPTDDTGTTDTVDTSDTTDTQDTEDTTDTVDTSDTTDTQDTEDTTAYCADGTVPAVFDPTGTGSDYEQVVGDFTVPTTDGDWTLSVEWTGCDTYIFLNYIDGYSYPQGWLDSSFVEWAAADLGQTHWFFQSYESDSTQINIDISRIAAKVDAALAPMDKAIADELRSRIHFVTESAWSAGGGNGTMMSSYGAWGFNIDRFQSYREQGYLSDPVYSWNKTPILFATYESEFHHFEARRQQTLDAAGADTHRVFDDQPIDDWGWAGVKGYGSVTLPDAATMATYDTLELDLTLDCGHPHYEQCPEWDYLVYAYLCDPDDSTSCGTEIGRYITTYARPGRWVVDASSWLAELTDGGEQHFAFYTTQGYDVTLDLRLSNTGKGAAPVGMEWLWSGGTFNADYNANHESVTFTPPVDATRVEVMAVISGHGYSSDADYCGEFCDHQHEFTVNGGTPQVIDDGTVSDTYGCANRISDGVVPGQYGTWVYGRGGWCPGLEVQPHVLDITSNVTLGVENTIGYRGLLGGAERTVESTDGRIDMVSYVVYSR
jgi:hypothetical protein